MHDGPHCTTEPEDFKTKVKAIKGLIKNNKIRVKKLLDDPIFKADNPGITEMKNYIRIAHGHLENARIYLGKALKSYEESAAANAFDKAFDNQERTHLDKEPIQAGRPMSDFEELNEGKIKS